MALHDVVFVATRKQDVLLKMRVAATGTVANSASELQSVNDPSHPMDIPPDSSDGARTVWRRSEAQLSGIGTVDSMNLYVTNKTPSATAVSVFLSATQNGKHLPGFNAGVPLPANSDGEVMLGTLQKGEHDYAGVALKLTD